MPTTPERNRLTFRPDMQPQERYVDAYAPPTTTADTQQFVHDQTENLLNSNLQLPSLLATTSADSRITGGVAGEFVADIPTMIEEMDRARQLTNLGRKICTDNDLSQLQQLRVERNAIHTVIGAEALDQDVEQKADRLKVLEQEIDVLGTKATVRNDMEQQAVELILTIGRFEDNAVQLIEGNRSNLSDQDLIKALVAIIEHTPPDQINTYLRQLRALTLIQFDQLHSQGEQELSRWDHARQGTELLDQQVNLQAYVRSGVVGPVLASMRDTPTEAQEFLIQVSDGIETANQQYQSASMQLRRRIGALGTHLNFRLETIANKEQFRRFYIALSAVQDRLDAGVTGDPAQWVPETLGAIPPRGPLIG